MPETLPLGGQLPGICFKSSANARVRKGAKRAVSTRSQWRARREALRVIATPSEAREKQSSAAVSILRRPLCGHLRMMEIVVTDILTKVTVVATYSDESRPGRTPPGDAGGGGRVRFPRAGPRQPWLSGGSGPKRPAGTMTGLRGNPLHWGGRGRITPVPQWSRPQEVRELELSGGVRSLPQVP